LLHAVPIAFRERRDIRSSMQLLLAAEAPAILGFSDRSEQMKFP
jgi:hypothetical protein